MSSAATLPRAPARWGRSVARPAAVAVGSAAVGAVLAATTWAVLAAAERPGTLSPPSLRAHRAHPWVLGPLHGLLPGLSAAPHQLHSDMVVALVVGGVGWFAVWMAAPALGSRALLGATAAAHGILFLGPPLALTDVFNYGLYGRMAALHGLNPYRAFPAQAAGDPLYPLANWHHLRSPYGPLFTLGTEALTPLGAHGWFWAWKAIVVLTSFATVVLAGALAARLGASRPRAIAALGLSPLLLLAEVGGFHQDVPALACLVGAAWCLVRGRDADAPRWADRRRARSWWSPPASSRRSRSSWGSSCSARPGARGRSPARRRRAPSWGSSRLVAFGGALPDLGTQGAARHAAQRAEPARAGRGPHGADQAVRSAAQAALAAVALAATAAVALRRRWALPAIGVLLFCARPRAVVGHALVPRLGAALHRRRACRGGWPRWRSSATCGWRSAACRSCPGILHAAGYFPTRTTTGLQNHLEFQRLVR